MKADAVQLPDAVDEIIAEYLDALDRGQAPSRADWLTQHPEQADALAHFLDDLAYLSPVPSAAPDMTQAVSTERVPAGCSGAVLNLELTLANGPTDAGVGLTL